MKSIPESRGAQGAPCVDAVGRPVAADGCVINVVGRPMAAVVLIPEDGRRLFLRPRHGAFGVLLVALAAAPVDGAEEYREHEEAAFPFSFTRYVEWPPERAGLKISSQLQKLALRPRRDKAGP